MRHLGFLRARIPQPPSTAILGASAPDWLPLCLCAYAPELGSVCYLDWCPQLLCGDSCANNTQP